MTWERLSANERRMVRIGGVVVLAVLLLRSAILPLVEALGETRTRLENARAMLHREEMLVAGMAEHARHLEAAAERLISVGPRLLPGSTPAAAQNALASILERAATTAPARIDQLELLPIGEAGEGLRAPAVRVHGETDFEGLVTLLAALDAGPILITVEALQVTAAGRMTASLLEEEQPTEVLSFQLRAAGFVLEGEHAEAADPPRKATADGSGRADASGRPARAPATQER